jgi:hypothetical protein
LIAGICSYGVIYCGIKSNQASEPIILIYPAQRVFGELISQTTAANACTKQPHYRRRQKLKPVDLAGCLIFGEI